MDRYLHIVFFFLILNIIVTIVSQHYEINFIENLCENNFKHKHIIGNRFKMKKTPKTELMKKELGKYTSS